jgi:glucoside 3-dehydrogenase (cytochrome c) hitch-hiker subunit
MIKEAIPRRDALKLLGAACAAPVLAALSPDELLAFGQGLHARLAAAPGPAVFKTLDPHQGATVAVLVDRILPQTETPGALAVRAHEFIDLMLTEVVEAAERDRFLKGLAQLDVASRAAWGRDFVDCQAAQQVELMNAQEDEAAAAAAAVPVEMSWGRRRPPKAHFFHQLKHLTLLAYYTSEPGLVGELGFEVMPGSYAGCPRSEPRARSPARRPGTPWWWAPGSPAAGPPSSSRKPVWRPWSWRPVVRWTRPGTTRST